MRFRPWILFVFVAPAATSIACNDILGINPPHPEGDVGGAGGIASTSTTTTSSQGGAGGAAETGGSGGAMTTSTTTTDPCAGKETTETFDSVQDVPLFEGACNGAISPGNTDFANIGLGVGALQFVISDTVHAAFENGNVKSMTLTLYRAPTCGDPNPCTVKEPGDFEARPLRNDWQEGNGSSYSGADYCRRSAGNPGPQWEMPGAKGVMDSGEVSGTTSILDEDETFVLDMDPDIHAPWIGDADHKLSVRISRTDGVAVFVAVQHEASTASTRPKLTVTTCPQN